MKARCDLIHCGDHELLTPALEIMGADRARESAGYSSMSA
jgi:hypothetical protein